MHVHSNGNFKGTRLVMTSNRRRKCNIKMVIFHVLKATSVKLSSGMLRHIVSQKVTDVSW
jgi:hypothetical protein